jgi:subtilisin family serine protease
MYRGVVFQNGSVDTQDSNGHGTHVAGSLAGFGGSSDGVAKHAKLAFTDLAGPDGFLRTTSTMGDDYYKFAYDVGARIHSDSWGYSSSYYGVESYEVDHFVHTNPFFLPLFAAGNSGYTRRDGIRTLGSPANAKNALAIGATFSPNSYAGAIDYFSGEKRIWTVNVKGHDAKHWTHTRIRAVNGRSDLTLSLTHAVSETRAINALPLLACDPLLNPEGVAGKIVFVLRGISSFAEKGLHAQTAGAVAVIIGNDSIESTYTFMSGQDDVELLSIPMLFVPMKDGRFIQALIRTFPLTNLSITQVVSHPVLSWENIPTWSSAGPTADGRVKPDLVAPGESILSAKALTDQDVTEGLFCSVSWKTGTSMATPITSGGVALIRQYFIDGYYLVGEQNKNHGFEPSAALMRAVLINGAQPIEGVDSDGTPLEPPPSFRQGFGRVNLSASLPSLISSNTSHQALVVLDEFVHSFQNTGQTYGMCFLNTESDEPLRITLAWTDPAPSIVSDGSLVNDLDLQLYRLTPHRGANDLIWPLEGVEDRLNTVEKIVWSFPDIGGYHVVINAHAIRWGNQTFAIAATGNIIRIGQNISYDECRRLTLSPPPPTVFLPPPPTIPKPPEPWKSPPPPMDIPQSPPMEIPQSPLLIAPPWQPIQILPATPILAPPHQPSPHPPPWQPIQFPPATPILAPPHQPWQNSPTQPPWTRSRESPREPPLPHVYFPPVAVPYQGSGSITLMSFISANRIFAICVSVGFCIWVYVCVRIYVAVKRRGRIIAPSMVINVSA